MFVDLIVDSVESANKLQAIDGSFPAGHNGPYNNTETAIRNTCHLLIANIFVYKVTLKDSFNEAALKYLSYVKNAVHLNHKSGIQCRINPTRNPYNGLVGQAWIIEALCEAGSHFDDFDSYSLAIGLARKFDYSPSYCTWLLPSEKHTIKYDRTLNHNIWFAAALSIIPKEYDLDIRKCIEHFVDQLFKLIQIYPNGIIHHSSPYYCNSYPIGSFAAPLRAFRNFTESSYIYQKSIAYHSFNLYGLAILQNHLSNNTIKSLFDVYDFIGAINTHDFKTYVSSSKYSFPYNPVGFELAYMLSIFQPNNLQKILSYCYRQVAETYCFESKLFKRDTSDSYTSAARVYEITRLLPFLSQL